MNPIAAIAGFGGEKALIVSGQKKREGCKSEVANKGWTRHFEQIESSSALKSKHTQERWRPGLCFEQALLSKHAKLYSFSAFFA